MCTLPISSSNSWQESKCVCIYNHLIGIIINLHVFVKVAVDARCTSIIATKYYKQPRITQNNVHGHYSLLWQFRDLKKAPF